MPVSSITLPKTAPKRKMGKKDLIYITALTINNSVYPGNTGRPDTAAANNAKIGANKITEKPRYAKVTKRIKLRIIATISIYILSFSFNHYGHLNHPVSYGFIIKILFVNKIP